MTIYEFYQALQDASCNAELEAAIEAFDATHGDEVSWVPVGNRDNNRGTIEISADPGHSCRPAQLASVPAGAPRRARVCPREPCDIAGSVPHSPTVWSEGRRSAR